MVLSEATILRALPKDKWLTPSQVCKTLRNLGESGFDSPEDYEMFKTWMPHRQLNNVFNRLVTLGIKGLIDIKLGTGSDKGKLVYKQLEELSCA